MSAAVVTSNVEPAFERRVATYEASASIQTWLAGWVDTWVEPAWPLGADVVELGAGTGLLTRRLTARGSLVALDRSAKMVEEGRRRVPHATWREGDARDLPAESYDRVYSSAMLQWLDDPDEAFRCWAGALKPGGRMVHGLFVHPSLSELVALEPEAVPLTWRDAETWCRAAGEAGLRVRRRELRRREVRHRDARSFFRSLHDTGVTPATPRLGAGRLRTLLRQYDACQRCADGAVRATWTALLLELEKD